MNIIVGSSRARDIGSLPPLKGDLTVRTLSKPGGRYHQMNEMIEQQIINDHGGPPLFPGINHYYIFCGLCDITTKLRAKNYEEVVYQELPQTTLSRVTTKIDNLKQFILDQGGIPIFCTIVPQHIATWNFHRLNIHRTSHLKHSKHYEEMQSNLMIVLEQINQHIIATNLISNVATPKLHSSVLHNQGKGRHQSYFEHTLLTDGVHPKPKLLKSWAKSFKKLIQLNRKH